MHHAALLQFAILGRLNVSFVELLRKSRAQVLARPTDPWRFRLERARGKLGDDDIERVSTQALFDLLELPQKPEPRAPAGAWQR
jgi:hypothetical protein